MNVTHAIDALMMNIDQKTNLPIFVCFGRGSGIGFIISLKKLNFNSILVSGTNINKETTILIKVNSSLNCQI